MLDQQHHQIKYYVLAVSEWVFTRAGPKAVTRCVPALIHVAIGSFLTALLGAHHAADAKSGRRNSSQLAGSPATDSSKGRFLRSTVSNRPRRSPGSGIPCRTCPETSEPGSMPSISFDFPCRQASWCYPPPGSPNDRTTISRSDQSQLSPMAIVPCAFWPHMRGSSQSRWV